jgi:hypothetical protein
MQRFRIGDGKCLKRLGIALFKMNYQILIRFLRSETRGKLVSSGKKEYPRAEV